MAEKVDYRAQREKAWRQSNLDNQKAIDNKRQVAVETKKTTLENAKLDTEKKKQELSKDQDLITSAYQSVINDKDYYEAAEDGKEPIKRDLSSLNAGTVNKEGRTISVDDVVQKRSAMAKYIMKNKIYITDKLKDNASERKSDKEKNWVKFLKDLAEHNLDKKKDPDAAYVYNNVEQPEYTRHAVKLIETFFKDRGKNPDKYKKNYKDGK